MLDPALWRGVADWEDHDGWRTPWRLPRDGVALLAVDALAERAQHAAGVRAVVRTDARELTLDLDAGPGCSPVDVLVDGVLRERLPLAVGEQRVTLSLPPGEKLLEVWLPQFGRVAVGGLTLGEAGFANPGGAGPRWIAYGSSITQCAEADGPSSTWPALVARREGWDLVNLGFGGQCHLDQLVARSIRDAPADLITLCLGINVHGQGTFGPRGLRSAVLGFLDTVRDGHPHTPIVVITPIASPSREHEESSAGMTLAQIRDVVSAAARDRAAAGDPHLDVLDGLALLGLDDAGLLVDGLHPGQSGSTLIAERAAPALSRMRANLQ